MSVFHLSRSCSDNQDEEGSRWPGTTDRGQISRVKPPDSLKSIVQVWLVFINILNLKNYLEINENKMLEVTSKCFQRVGLFVCF